MKNVKVISEYSSNRFLYPVKATNEDFIMKDNFGEVIFIAKAGCNLTLHCFQLLDAIATILRSKVEEQCNEETGLRLDEWLINYKLIDNPDLINRLKEGSDNIDLKTRKIYNKDFTISIKKLVKHPCLNHMQYHNMYEALRLLNEFEFKTCFKFYSNKDMNGNVIPKPGFHGSYNNLSEDEFGKLFDIAYINKPGTSIKDSIQINFNTLFSFIFVHNVLTKGFTYQNKSFDRIRSCSTNVKLIHRRFLLSCSFPVKLTPEKVCNYLGLTSKDKWNNRKVLDRIVKELTKFELSTIVKHEKDIDDYYYIIKRCSYPR